MKNRGLPLLAVALALQPSIEAAIAAYDTQRRPQTANMVLANRQGGPEKCLEIVERRAPERFVDLDTVISRAELEEIARSYKRTAAFDPEVLNNLPSLGVGQPSAHSRYTRGSSHRVADIPCQHG